MGAFEYTALDSGGRQHKGVIEGDTARLTMKIENVPFGVTDWAAVPRAEHPGETGTAWWRTIEAGNVQREKKIAQLQDFIARFGAGTRAM